MTLTLSVLDQSLARSPDQAPVALAETLEMARHCERLGFERFWLSEHHAFPSVAGSAPEILLAAVGAVTSSIRIGSGGIMLPHYSPYKVAEQFSLLANLYPGRVDLGVGRAPGADMATAMALATDGRPNFERFPELVDSLSGYIRDQVSTPLVCPQPPSDLPLWLLGSSGDSAMLAASRGLPYNLAAFINPQAPASLIEYYRRHFLPSSQCDQPYATLTVSVFCADSESRARTLQLTHDINLFRFFSGQNQGQYMTPEQAQDYPISPQLRQFIDSRDGSRAVGSPDQVRRQLQALAERFAVDEIMAVTNMYYLEDRLRSFELLSEAF